MKSLKHIRTMADLELLLVTGGSSLDIAINLKKSRLLRGLTQKELADSVLLSTTAISHYENGSRIPDIDTILQLSSCLQIDIKDLVTCNSRFE
ncbi:transcriptional regulator [Lactiplantibacillus pentosus]|uniref:helix-turn-helix domain-containing protein n=1 Tax=Lactiplantibacillus pentosus TaxID=1589 RepID=UPI000D01CFFD|nr:helix-turn-helix transcriptional regulator [Lactiplantibacillus pentosus]MCT3301689.1 XRE family transcriptional regulator [Lactiplantibacillus pentosus]PRO80053.1 transcriptional regulator [Lactiplantibacillus pentosus]PRO82817.1 transcriptional regulator [Lactiplantibacillus pentosus]PRO92720.1 transcriptional regulator [Lactiplantibacillus pentosus]